MRLNPANRPSLTLGRTSYTYSAGAKRIPGGAAPDVKNMSWSMTARVAVPFIFTGTINTVTIDLKPQDTASAEGSKKAARMAAYWENIRN